MTVGAAGTLMIYLFLIGAIGALTHTYVWEWKQSLDSKGGDDQ